VGKGAVKKAGRIGSSSPCCPFVLSNSSDVLGSGKVFGSSKPILDNHFLQNSQNLKTVKTLGFTSIPRVATGCCGKFENSLSLHERVMLPVRATRL
jgi:hypothetical protein